MRKDVNFACARANLKISLHRTLSRYFWGKYAASYDFH